MAGDLRGSRKAKRDSRRRLWSSPSALAVAAATGVGVLTSVFLGANRNLTGWQFLVAILLAASALLLIVKAFNRAQAGVGWVPVFAIGVLLGVASMGLAALPTAHHPGASDDVTRLTERGSLPVGGDGGLELSLRQVQPEFLRLAFYKPISLPQPTEDRSSFARGEAWTSVTSTSG